MNLREDSKTFGTVNEFFVGEYNHILFLTINMKNISNRKGYYYGKISYYGL